MTGAERKLRALKKYRNKLDPYGCRTQNVKTKVQKVEDAFCEYVKSDNISPYLAVVEPLSLVVEAHSDFQAAISYIDRAIANTENEIADALASDGE